jgi:hypothetical protein
VNAAYVRNFQCLVSSLDRAGYQIAFMGGWRRHGSVPHSKHPAGKALDINQTARNRVTRKFPQGINRMARACGLFHGAEWRRADAGHFEVPTRTARSRLRQEALAQ